MKTVNIRRRNRISLMLLFLGMALACILMSLPVYTFQASVYTKKSSNTFVGDEKYVKARAEAEAAAEEYKSQGMDVEIRETVTERKNSKGETTSLITFTVEEQFTRNVWSFLKYDLSASHILKIILILMILAGAAAAAGSMGSMGTEYRRLPSGVKHVRAAACLFLLVDLLLIPVFILVNNYTFWRKLSLYNQELITEGKDAFFEKIDRFLFQGAMGDKITSALKNLEVTHQPMLWMLAVCMLISLLAAVDFWRGTVRHAFFRGLLYVFVAVVCVITLYPYYVMFVTAFRSNAETLDMYFLHLAPVKWVWSNLTDIISRGVPRFLLNSVMIAGGATLLALLCGIPAAYAMARMNFRGKKLFLGFVIMSQMFSPVVLLIGISQLMNTLGLNDTILGLVFVNAAFNQAFAIWLLRGTFISISPDMEQAARIDGCSTMGALIRVLLPMAAPGIVTTLIFVFINAWNEFTISTVLISTSSNRPITVGITQFSSFNMIEWQYLFAASLLATIPVVILFMFIEKHLTSGLTSGGVKG